HGRMSLSQDHIVLAAEYVLGTLDVAELDEAQALLESNPEFGAMVREWERRLGELNVMVGAIEPPAGTFDKIKERIGSTVQPSAIHLPDPSADRPLPRLCSAPPLDMAVRPPRRDGAGPSPEPRGEVVVLARRVRRARGFASALGAIAAAACALFVVSLVRSDLLPEQLRPKPRTVEVVRTVEKPAEK